MPFVPVPNATEAEIRMTLDNQKIENTLYFYASGGSTVATLTALGDRLESWWTLQVAPLLPIDVALREIVMTDLTSTTGLQVTRALEDPVFGTLGQPALPNNVSLAISFRSAIRGRGYRGRNYIPCLTENAVVNNTVSASVVDDWADAYRDILVTVAGPSTPYVWVVVSRYLGVDADGKPIPRVVGNAEPITAVVVTDATVDSMRRRLPGRGR